MAYKFIVTGQIIPHEIGAVVEFDEMPHQGMLHRLQLVTATPAEAEKPADEADPAEAEKPADEADPAEAEKPADEADPAEAEKPARRSRN